MHLNQNLATYKMAGCLKRSTEIMGMMNHMIKLPELQRVMGTMAKEMEKAGLIDEIVEETMDLADDVEEEEAEEEVAKVLTELDLDLIEKTPGVTTKTKTTASKEPVAQQEDAADAELLERYQKMKET